IPPLSAPTFGLIQESLRSEPFWLLVACSLLNKTNSRSALPIFHTLKTTYPTPEDIISADEETIKEMLRPLGLFNKRAKTLKDLAGEWVEHPPQRGKRYKVKDYPDTGDHNGNAAHPNGTNTHPPSEENCKGALEIGHLPGCGRYAYDAWRIFCRDELRFSGGVVIGEPEWKRVNPQDKELRAYVKWLWAKEGVVWD
ncbi:DNA glycosylase, partial [Piedraia hortae CBS 480.64]